MNILINILILVIGLLIGFIMKSYLPSYFKEKGKNLATKEDIASITQLQEEVKSTFHSILEKQKSELNEKLEVLKHQQNKLLKDYELYTMKRFEYYPELHKEIELSITKIRDLKFRSSGDDFRYFNSQDIEIYMTDNFKNHKLFTSVDKQRIILQWDTNQEKAMQDLKNRISVIEYHEAGNSYVNANNYYVLQRLFFSDEVSEISRDLLDTIYELWRIYASYAYDFRSNKTGEVEKEKIDMLSKKLFIQMQNELSGKEKEFDLSS
ncbi:hypothetical protein [Priestia megaterium]|uniref:hypothetical protein n=1 Tax=Priestia megaterium TaxID=1404 RepID=UPI001C533B74|nr:hypothetical protein [Priestia megaterium]MBW0933920.1 hypothetical protein [Priestia megaterium]